MSDGFITISYLQDLHLPALPRSRSGLSRRARQWQTSPLARRRHGTWEYHFSLLPCEAQVEIAGRLAGFGSRSAVVQQVRLLTGGGMRVSVAVALVSHRAGVSGSTVWRWLPAVEQEDREALEALVRAWRAASPAVREKFGEVRRVTFEQALLASLDAMADAEALS